MKYKNSTICDIHDDIITALDFLSKCKGYTKESKKVFNDLKEACEEAKIKGQKMENRLFKYRESIENLGYSRNL